MDNEKKPMKPAAMVLFVIFLLFLVVLAYFTLVPSIQKADALPVYGAERWMGDVPDDRLLSDIVIPGTHDSTTKFVRLAYFSKCQSASVAEQLKGGYRYLDIRLGADKGADKLRLMHGFAACRTGSAVWSADLYLDAVLADCAQFLTDHPTECILFVVKKEHGSAEVSEVQQLLDKALASSGISLLETDKIPAMGEARGKLVLFRRYSDDAGLGARAGIPLLWEDQPGSERVSPAWKTDESSGFTLQVQDRYEYNAKMKWEAFTESLSGGDVTLDFLSTKGTAKYGHPFRYAKPLNKKLMKAELKTDPGIDGGVWMIVDFGSPKLAEKIWKLNFPEESGK